MSDRAWLNTRQCADRLGVSTAFIRAEIREGRLVAASVIKRPAKNAVYRVRPADLEAYRRRYEWHAQNG